MTPDIHPADHIHGFLAAHPQFPTRDEAREEYFRVGRRSAEQLAALLADLRSSPKTLLEFASGYGCVTRHLPDALGPATTVTPCDIHPAALDFIRATISLDGILSDRVPERADLGQHDAVFALSFFSHMPLETWRRWLRRLVAATRPDGLVIFTTHGLRSAEPMGVTLPPLGFWFSPASEQVDLDVADYGTTVTSPAFVVSQIESMPAEIVLFREAAWFGHQDLFVLRRR